MNTPAPDPRPLRCPACGYDVSTTLADGIRECPECGGAIEEWACLEAVRRPRVDRLKLRYGIGVYFAVFGALLGMGTIVTWVFVGLGTVCAVVGSAHANRVRGAWEEHRGHRVHLVEFVLAGAFGIALTAVLYAFLSLLVIVGLMMLLP